MSMGLVSQLRPLRSEPSFSVMVISWRGWSAGVRQRVKRERKHEHALLTHSSFSALSFSNIFRRCSKNSGGGLSCRHTGSSASCYVRHDARAKRTSRGWADPVSFAFLSLDFFAEASFGGALAAGGCDVEATGVVIAWCGWW